MLPKKHLLKFALLAIVISQYDLLIHSMLGVLHYVIEWVELGLEEAIEHVFHTNRKQSQIIVFYLLFAVAAGLLYRLWLKLPGFWEWLKNYGSSGFYQARLRMAQFWDSGSLSQRIVWVSGLMLGMYGMVLLSF